MPVACNASSIRFRSYTEVFDAPCSTDSGQGQLVRPAPLVEEDVFSPMSVFGIKAATAVWFYIWALYSLP